MQYEDVKPNQVLKYYNEVLLVQAIRSKEDTWSIKAMNSSLKEDTYKPENLKSIFQINGFDIQITKVNDQYYYGSLCKTINGAIQAPLETLISSISKQVKKIKDDLDEHLEVELIGADVMPETTILEDVKVELEITAVNLTDKYNEIVGNISSLTSSINDSFSLEDTQELAKVFLEAKQKIEELTNTKPGKFSSTMSSFMKKLPGGAKLIQSATQTLAENSSIQKNINHLFGTIHTKYEKLVTVGEGLQTAKGHIVAQVEALEILALQSIEDLKEYTSETDIPMRKLSLDTQIKSSIAKYRARLLKIDGSITACQTTIIALGEKLPSLKTDLTDEMAIGALLNSIDDYQKMYVEIAELASTVTDATSEKVHNTIENLMELQINDTHTMEYIAKSTQRSEKFANMLESQTGKLAAKTVKDAQFIRSIAQGESLEYAQSSIKKLTQ